MIRILLFFILFQISNRKQYIKIYFDPNINSLEKEYVLYKFNELLDTKSVDIKSTADIRLTIKPNTTYSFLYNDIQYIDTNIYTACLWDNYPVDSSIKFILNKHKIKYK